MNRRKLFSFLAAAPVAAVAAVATQDALAAEPAAAAESSEPMFGEVRHFWRPMGSAIAEAYVVIWNGRDWAPFDGPDGIAVRNQLLKMKA